VLLPRSRTEAPPMPSPGSGGALARFAQRRGVPVLEALGAYWMRRNRYVYQSLPPQLALTLEPREVDRVLRGRRLLAMQYPTPEPLGESSGLFICRTPGFTLARLTKTRRARVRKGQALAQLRYVTPDELLAQGLELNLETMARQRRFAPEFGQPARWARFVAAVRDSPEVSVFGAFVEGRLATYAVACRDGAWMHGLFKMQRTGDLRRNTSCALDAWILEELARDPGIEVLVNGRSQGEQDPLYEYKLSLGFEVLPQRCVLRLHPALGLLARPPMARAAGVLARRLPSVTPLRRMANLARAASASRAREAAPGRQEEGA
jgi:hypothetical protein